MSTELHTQWDCSTAFFIICLSFLFFPFPFSRFIFSLLKTLPSLLIYWPHVQYIDDNQVIKYCLFVVAFLPLPFCVKQDIFWTVEFWKIRFVTGGIYNEKCTMFKVYLCTGQKVLDVYLCNFLPYSFEARFLLKCGHLIVSLCPISLKPGLSLNLRLVCFARLTVSKP